MKRLVVLLSVGVLIFSVQDMNAQSLRQRLKQAILKDNVDTVEIRDSDSTTVVEIDNPTESSSAHITTQGYMKAFGLTDNVPHEAKYDFDAYIQMEMTTYKKNGKVDGQTVYDNYVDKKDADYAMVFRDGNDQSTIIFDAKNKAMLILTDSDGEKTGFATTIDPETWAEVAEDYTNDQGNEDLDWEAYKPVKTGKTKKILGYTCDEYLVKDEDTEVHMWVSEELGKELHKEWMKNQQAFGSAFAYAWALNGMVLEYDAIEKNGEKSVMLVKDIDLNHSHSVDTNDYAIMSMRKKTKEEKGEE
jgi:antitoxin component YwqK of YwqJK toxin-antitoxin module